MPTPPSIKLQMVLHHGAAALADADFTARLAALGMRSTGRGAASASAELSPDAFAQLWGKPPPTAGGFDPALETKPLAVPPALAGTVQSITTVPRHTTFD